jgi:putative endonuclease
VTQVGPATPGRAAVGRIGEDLAVRFLLARGARIVGRNVRSARGEIDVVADIDGVRVAVEVKSRLGAADDPVEAFHAAKAARVRAAAARLHPPVHRVDFIGVTLGREAVTIRWVPRAG